MEDCERRLLFCAYHLDPSAEVPGPIMGPVATAAAGVVASSPLGSVPLLHSRSSATAKLYLDFDGDVASTWSSYSVPATPAYDVDGDASSFSDQELANIRFIWAKVAEKYAPFNIDVTTQYPGDLNNKHALRAVIGGNGGWFAANTGGVGYVGGFYNADPNTVYVFSNNLSSANSVGEAASHESGHGFGLEHQSAYSGTTKTSEYSGGDSLRAPVMGNSYSAQRGLWWYGPNTYGSTTIQDDLAVISGTSDGFGYRADDYGGTAGTAVGLTLSGTGLSASGVIEKTSDADWFKFVATAGSSVTLSASIGSYIRSNAGAVGAGDGSGATLDALIELRDAGGNLIASADTASLGETLSASGLAAGTYYFVVKSHGAYADIGTYDVTGTLTPGTTGNPPTANAGGGSYAAAEGGSVGLSGANSTNGSGGSTGLTYLWDLDGDGVFGETGAGAMRGNETGVSPTLIATGLDGPSTYVVSLKVTDSATGLTSSVATANVSITNVAPTGTMTGAPVNSPEGTAINLTASATDPGTLDTIGYAWSVTKNGSAYTSGAGSSYSFTPTDNGTYVVTLTATDDDGGVGTASKTIVVTNVAPTPAISGAPTNTTEGAVIAMTGSATDPGAADTILYAWSVTKNGQAYASGTGASFGLTPGDNGTYVVTLTATDDDGGVAATSNTISVVNVAPFVTTSGATVSRAEGSAAALTAVATDPGAAEGLTYAWAVTRGGQAYASGTGSAWSFTPGDDGAYVITVTVTDKDGGVGTDTETLTVTNVAPTLTLGGATEVATGTSFLLGLSSSDPGQDTIVGWSIDWGDGTVETVTGNPQSAAHVYAAEGNYTIAASASDEDGTYAASNTRAVAVADVLDTTPPTATLAWVGTLTAGAATQTFGVAYHDDVAFDASTLGNDDVLVTGPNGFSQWAHFVELAIQIDGGGRVATYSFTPPGGAATWSYAANGNYTFTLADGRVADAAGNAAAGGTLGGFAARLAVPDLGGNTTETAAYLGIVANGYNTTSSDYVSKGDRNDYFRLRLKSTAAIDVKLYGMTEDADVQLIDGNGRVVQTSARAGTRSEIITRTLAAGTYYLRAYYSGAGSTPYWLRVSSGVALAAPVATPAPVPVSRPVAASSASLFGTQRITAGGVAGLLKA